MKDDLMTTTEAAEVLGVTPSYVRRLIREGVLPIADEIGAGNRKTYLIDPADLEPLREQQPGPGRPRSGGQQND